MEGKYDRLRNSKRQLIFYYDNIILQCKERPYSFIGTFFNSIKKNTSFSRINFFDFKRLLKLKDSKGNNYEYIFGK